MNISLTDEQYSAIKLIKTWFMTSAKYKPFVLAGYAGTGKSTVISKLGEELKILESQIRYVAFTGKAALVMRKKGLTESSTIHKLIYEPREGTIKGEVVFEKLHRLDSEVKLIVVDEASMISKELQEDLESFGIPILYVGDSGQLPPISKDVTNLMANPHFTLQHIHRQALENPIIWIANQVRIGNYIKHGKYGDSVLKTKSSKIGFETLKQANQILCGKNITRKSINAQMRAGLGYLDIFPEVGDKLVCLKNNARNGLINGMTGICGKFNSKTSNLKFTSDENDIYNSLKIDKHIFTGGEIKYSKKIEVFDFSYGLTVHKYQGSEADNIIVFEERLGDSDFHRKWLYTAYTRAANKLITLED